MSRYDRHVDPHEPKTIMTITEMTIESEVTRVHARLEARLPGLSNAEATLKLVRVILAPTPEQLAERAALAEQLAAPPG